MKRLFIVVFSFCALGINAQTETISLLNPSFEDSPRQGLSYETAAQAQQNNIKNWFDCGILHFEGETAPDIHPKDYWGNRKQPSDGRTYLGMVTRDNDSHESVSQELSTPLKAGKCYSFSVELSKSENYLSPSRMSGNNVKQNYTTPAVFRLWGGYGYCGTAELLAESVPVKNSEWKTYTFKLSPKANYRYVKLEAYYKVPALIPYNGHILVDNCSDLVEINCEEEVIAVADFKKKVLPPHKRVKKKPKTQVITPPKKKAEEAVVSTKPAKKILNLDRNTIRKGQTIEIQNLYFTADVATINRDSYEVLDEIYDFLRTNSDISVEIGGHTNGNCSHDYCDKLSTDRAKVVAEYLVEKGILSDRLTFKGYGKRKWIASNLTKEGRMKNQRVEIKILSIG